MGFAWYDPATFEAFRCLMPDMSSTYEDWREGARKDAARAEREGYRVIRIAMRPSEFFDWCGARGIGVPTIEARRLFAAERAGIVVKGERSQRQHFRFF
jgi:hypothetical protein